jgi:hypothetical protein
MPVSVNRTKLFEGSDFLVVKEVEAERLPTAQDLKVRAPPDVLV